jgi:hypothetical protein
MKKIVMPEMSVVKEKHNKKNNLPAEAYAVPHTMDGKEIDGTEAMTDGEYSTDKSQRTAGIRDPIPNGVSLGFAREVKTSGIEMRGFGAATKGKMSRGPMA